jgi:hypothetical protein
MLLSNHSGTGMREQARNDARRGWKVSPLLTPPKRGCSCGEPYSRVGKHAPISDWTNAAGTDPGPIETRWNAWPDADPGIATGNNLRLGGELPRRCYRQSTATSAARGASMSGERGQHIGRSSGKSYSPHRKSKAAREIRSGGGPQWGVGECGEFSYAPLPLFRFLPGGEYRTPQPPNPPSDGEEAGKATPGALLPSRNGLPTEKRLPVRRCVPATERDGSVQTLSVLWRFSGRTGPAEERGLRQRLLSPNPGQGRSPGTVGLR